MKTSTAGRADIRQREGEVLRTYRDSRGIPTCCVGHTGRMSPPIPVMGQTFTPAQSDAFLAADLAPVEQVINTVVTVPLSQTEFDAMASLGFNIGAAGLRKSTVVRKLNMGDVAGAAQAFMLWDHPAELTSRRVAERKQFLAADTPGIAAHRAATLAAKADRARTNARRTTTGAAVSTAIGTAAASASAASHHGHLAWLVAALFAVGAAVDSAASMLHRHAALTFTANARTQAAAAAPTAGSAARSASAAKM